MQTVTSAGKRSLRGFSLVELVIVIVIIGIIAAIAIPRVSRGSRGAGETSLASNLAILRNAIELYASEHGGDYPGAKEAEPGATAAVSFVKQLTMYSNGNGQVNATRDVAGGYVYGPYLRTGMPPAPVGENRGSTDVLIDNVNTPPTAIPNGGEGWVYNANTGDIILNSAQADEAGRDFNTY